MHPPGIHALLLHRNPGQELQHDATREAGGLFAPIVVERIVLDEIESDDGLRRCEFAKVGKKLARGHAGGR